MILMVGVAIFLAMNMGISGFSVAFAPSYGSKILSKHIAAILYGVGVIAGGLMFGPAVAATLVKKIAQTSFTGVSPLLIVFVCAGMMFLSNVLKVPQSTSFVTVASFVGAGMYFGSVNWWTVIKVLSFAAVFSVLSFGLSYIIKRAVYPPRPANLKLYEMLFEKRAAFKKFIIGHDTYAAFSVGSNNVANVAAPLLGLFNIPLIVLLLFIGPLFGLGAWLAGERVIKSVSRDIVPVGEFSATIVSFITATFVIIASSIGLPTPYVQFTTFALLGISCVKDGAKATFAKAVVQRILSVWVLVPLVTAALSYGLHIIFMGVRR